MALNSPTFMLFFLAILALHWILPRRMRTTLLLAASCLFYAVWNWRFLGLLTLSILVDFLVGLRLGPAPPPDDVAERRRRLAWLRLSLATQLGILGLFKYFDFFADSLGDVLRGLGLAVPPLHLDIVLPLGISYYTFKTLTYTLDVYYGRMAATRSLPSYALFVSFFPNLVAGPIDRAKSLLPQIASARRCDRAGLAEGLNLVFLGLFKKVFVADNLGHLFARTAGIDGRYGWDAMLPVYLFAAQIYCDFSGYTDMARGCGRCLGFDLAKNFRFPYLAYSPSDFWQRWHISLSTWLRDYVFTPLGGALRGPVRAYCNLGLTMLVCGIWHGASWTFVVWGALQGVLMIGHRVLQPGLKRLRGRLRPYLHRHVRRTVEVFVTFHLVCLGWVLFRADSLAQAADYLRRLAVPRGLTDSALALQALQFLAPLWIIESLQVRSGREELFRIGRIPVWGRAVLYSCLFYLVAFHAARAQSFIYATF